MAWRPEDDVPSWMDPSERAWFWREVAEANRQAIVDRQVEEARAALYAEFSRPVLWLAAVLGRIAAWRRRLTRAWNGTDERDRR
jgi:hypothetical protein